MQKTPEDDSAAPEHDTYAAMRLPNFRRFWIGNIVSILGLQMQSTTMVWEVYKRTGRNFDVGMVGLMQVIPVLSLALFAGYVADRIDRKLVLIGALSLASVASLGLAVVSFFEWPILSMFAFVFLIGVARAFLQPAKSSLVPQLVPRAIFSNAVTWNLGGFQLAAIAGPALGGWLLAWLGHPHVVYLLQASAASLFIILLCGVTSSGSAAEPQAATLKSLGEGIGFVWRNKVILGAMALDMFAVLLGGASALFPAFAKDVLSVGPFGYGWMASAPALGALVMSLALVHRPPMRKAGHALLWAVTGFGVSIIVFGLSRSFAISLGALLCMGAFDCISVVVRHTLVQMNTPDRMRGRVSAISGMFISASNELGEFESGLLAEVTSPVTAVVAGGIGTLFVVATAAASNPQLRTYGRLDGKDQQSAEAQEVLEVR
jgi:MFS family permease